MIKTLTLLFLLITSPAWAITFDAVSTGSNTSGALTVSHTVTSSGTNRAFFLLCAYENSTGTLSATYAGQSMTVIDSISGNGASAWAFVKLNPTTGANDWVATPSINDHKVCFGWSATDVDQTTGYNATTYTATSAGLESSSLTASVATDNDIVLDIISWLSTGKTYNVGADQTERVNLDTGGAQGAGSQQAGSVSGDVMSWSWTGNEPFTHLAVVVIPPAAAATRRIAPIFFQ